MSKHVFDRFLVPKSRFELAQNVLNLFTVDKKTKYLRCRKVEIRAKFFFADFLVWLNRARRVTYENVVFNIFR